MTDFEKFVEMVKKANLQFELDEDKDRDEISLSFYAGYIGFVSVVTFSGDGNLLSIKAWE